MTEVHKTYSIQELLIKKKKKAQVTMIRDSNNLLELIQEKNVYIYSADSDFEFTNKEKEELLKEYDGDLSNMDDDLILYLYDDDFDFQDGETGQSFELAAVDYDAIKVLYDNQDIQKSLVFLPGADLDGGNIPIVDILHHRDSELAKKWAIKIEYLNNSEDYKRPNIEVLVQN